MKPLYYHWEWDLLSAPAALWPLISDTDRFNKEAGLPSVTYDPVLQEPLKNKRRKLSYTYLGVYIEWIEEPFEWVYPQQFFVNRHYSKGPLKEMRVHVTLSPRTSGGTRVIYETWSTPRSILGVVGSAVQIGVLSARSFESVTKKFDIQVQRARSGEGETSLSSGAVERLNQFIRTLSEDEKIIGKKLSAYIKTADGSELGKIRPYMLADFWGKPRTSVLRVFLKAARQGIVNFKWQLICPSCRGAKKTADSLKDLSTQAHCEICKMDVRADIESAVELAFMPNPAIAQSSQQTYCVGGPQVTPHILIQQLISPKETREVGVQLQPGSYLLSSMGISAKSSLKISSKGILKEKVSVNTKWSHDEIKLRTGGTLTISNNSDTERLVTLESTIANADAVTAAEVFTMQSFRDFFAHELIKSGEEISVGTVVVVFTDLKGSTKFYQAVGDAAAYTAVRDHFRILEREVAAHEGAIVKTIGDAIMAVFRRPLGALEAMLASQQAISGNKNHQLRLKAGIHSGPSIAVTLNERLDYFGTTINTASRLEGQSSGEELIISDPIYKDPEIQKFLTSKKSKFSVHSFSAHLKGFDEMDFKLWRITRK